MSVSLVPLRLDGDLAELANALASGFDGDPTVPMEILKQTRSLHQSSPRPDPWGSYVVHSDGRPVATGAFKWAPDDACRVEIAYMTFPAYEGQGYANATIAALSALALEAGAAQVVAHTLPVENASNRALQRNGFRFEGEVVDPEDGTVWRWSRR